MSRHVGVPGSVPRPRWTVRATMHDATGKRVTSTMTMRSYPRVVHANASGRFRTCWVQAWHRFIIQFFQVEWTSFEHRSDGLDWNRIRDCDVFCKKVCKTNTNKLRTHRSDGLDRETAMFFCIHRLQDAYKKKRTHRSDGLDWGTAMLFCIPFARL